MIRKILLWLFLATAWTASSAQVFLINGDSMYCYTDAEIRAIATKIVEREGCLETVSIMNSQIDLLHEGMDANRESFQAELNIKDQTIQMHLDQRKDYESALTDWKRKYNRTLIGAGAGLVVIMLLSLK